MKLLILVGLSISLVGCGEDNSLTQPHANNPFAPDANSGTTTKAPLPDVRIAECAKLKQDIADNPPWIEFGYSQDNGPFQPSSPSITVELHNMYAQIIGPFGGFPQPITNKTYWLKFCQVDVDATGLATFKELNP